MHESYAQLRALPADVLADTMVHLLVQERRVLMHPDMGNLDKLIAIFELVNTMAPPPISPSGGNGPGETAPSVAHSPGPSAALFTKRAQEAAGEPLTAEIARTVVSAEDYPELASGRLACRRDGHLVTASGRAIAAVTSVYVPSRLPVRICLALAGTNEPLGRVLAPLGARREELSAEVGRSRGLLWLPGDGSEPPAIVALAWERLL